MHAIATIQGPGIDFDFTEIFNDLQFLPMLHVLLRVLPYIGGSFNEQNFNSFHSFIHNRKGFATKQAP